MTLFQIPTQPNYPWYTFKVPLSGTLFTLIFRYNSRMSRWMLDIADSIGNPIVVGLPILINRNIAGQYSTLAGVPVGVFFATDDTQTESQPTMNSFQVDHTLFYGDDS